MFIIFQSIIDFFVNPIHNIANIFIYQKTMMHNKPLYEAEK